MCPAEEYIWFKHFCGSSAIMNFYSLKPNFFPLFEDGWNLKTMAYNKIDSTFASRTFFLLSVENRIWVFWVLIKIYLLFHFSVFVFFFLFGHFKHNYRACRAQFSVKGKFQRNTDENTVSIRFTFRLFWEVRDLYKSWW